jgi:hypothetical protein
VIASDIPVHRELAGGVATLVDPLDGAAWIAAIEAALQRNSRSPAYAAPTWQTHFEQVAEALRAIAQDPAVRPRG